jgi:hypothetical protein|tara:strand:- start:323 stop:721 length:399 start_codon:yes stop_codon:yes gene_type:complete
MNITKALPGRGDLTEKEYLKELENMVASETAAEEKRMQDFGEMKYEEALRRFLKNNPGKSEQDFIDSIRRINLSSGGKVIDFSKYKKDDDWYKDVKKLDLASMFTPGKTLSSLSKSERAAVNKLLRLTLGKE